MDLLFDLFAARPAHHRCQSRRDRIFSAEMVDELNENGDLDLVAGFDRDRDRSRSRERRSQRRELCLRISIGGDWYGNLFNLRAESAITAFTGRDSWSGILRHHRL